MDKTILLGLAGDEALIYGLFDPMDPAHIRYVGCTTRPAERLNVHRKRPLSRRPDGTYRARHTHKNAWVRSMARDGRTPELVTLEFSPIGERKDREHAWIVALLADGHRLTNATLGREGPERRNPTEQERARRSEANRLRMNRPEERERYRLFTKERMSDPRRRSIASETAKRQWSDPAHRANVIAKIRAYRRSPECQRNHSERMREFWWDSPEAEERRAEQAAAISGESNPSAKLTWESVDDIRRRYTEGSVTQRSLADEYGVTQTLISQIVRYVIWKSETSPLKEADRSGKRSKEAACVAVRSE